MFRISSTFTALAVAAALSAPAQAQSSVQSGSLTCDVSAGIGFIIGSQRSVNCTFTPNAGPPEYYSGSISKLGIDIGDTGFWGKGLEEIESLLEETIALAKKLKKIR